MRTVTYKSVLDRIAGYLGEADGLSVEDAAIASAKVNLFVRLGWQHYWWPETMDLESRTFRPAYDSTKTYAIHAEVYYPADGQYYQAMQTVPAGQPPSLPVAGGYQPNLAYWFPGSSSYSGSDYSATGTYRLGDIARNPADNQFYALYALSSGVTVSGAGTAAANGDYVWDGTQYNAANGYSIVLEAGPAASFVWQLNDTTATALYHNPSTFVTTPAVIGTWAATDGGSAPPPTVTVNNAITGVTAPFVPLYWTQLTPFIRSIDYEQDNEAALGLVRFAWDRNPETTRCATPMKFTLRKDFVQVYGCVGVVWLEYQRQAPTFTNTIYDAEQSYSAGVTLYDTATGDCWTTLEAISGGETPTSAPSSWSKVEFPYFLAEYVAQSAYAMLTDREQETPENFSVQNAAGYPLLVVEIDNLERKQGQTRQLNVRNGGRGVGMSPYSW